MLGKRIYKYNDKNEIETYHIINKDTQNNVYVIKDKDGRCSRIDNEEILSKYITLKPDGLLNIVITDKDSEYGCDVFVNVHIEGKLALSIRQNVYSISKMAFGSNKRMVGECLTKKNEQNENAMKQFFTFSKIDKVISITVYIDDTIDTILECLSQKDLNEYDEALANLHKQYKDKNVEGYCDTLRELLESNNFMYNFRDIFNITQINEVVMDCSGNLTEKAHEAIQDILCKYITPDTLLVYDKDIDMKSIVDDHMLISDKDGKIFLLAYSVIADYPIDEDIAKAFGLL